MSGVSRYTLTEPVACRLCDRPTREIVVVVEARQIREPACPACAARVEAVCVPRMRHEGPKAARNRQRRRVEWIRHEALT